MFHESFECDGELDSNDEQHDGNELTMSKLRWRKADDADDSGTVQWRRAETLGIDDWSIGEGRNNQPWSPISRCRAASWRRGVVEVSRTPCFAIERRKRKKTKDDTAPPANLIVPRTR
ncbi:unnamed protein product [Brassica rapa subsp. narinosa]